MVFGSIEHLRSLEKYAFELIKEEDDKSLDQIVKIFNLIKRNNIREYKKFMDFIEIYNELVVKEIESA